MRDVLQNDDPMKNIAANPRAAAVISFLLVLPFALLDLLFNRSSRQNPLDPVVLFGLLWLLAMVFILTLSPLVRSVRAGNNILTHPASLLLRVAVLIAVAWMWGVTVIDQLPCFIGLPNCD